MLTVHARTYPNFLSLGFSDTSSVKLRKRCLIQHCRLLPWRRPGCRCRHIRRLGCWGRRAGCGRRGCWRRHRCWGRHGGGWGRRGCRQRHFWLRRVPVHKRDVNQFVSDLKSNKALTISEDKHVESCPHHNRITNISNLHSSALFNMENGNFSLNWTHDVLRNLKTKNAQQKTLSTQW